MTETALLEMEEKLSLQDDKAEEAQGGGAAPSDWAKDTSWSWLVLGAAFCTQAIIFGLILCFGIYFVTLVDAFDTSKSAVALVGSIAYGIMCLTGILSSILVGAFGCRVVVMAGGLISAFGCLLSAFAQSLPQLYVTYGLINGLGLGLAFTPTVAVLPDYFHRYRFFATAFASVGSATGTLLFQPIFLGLIERFTWRGSMLINAGLALHICLFGTLLRSRSPRGAVSWRAVVRLDLFRDARFLLFLANAFLWGGSIYITFSLANALALSQGLSRPESALLVSTIGLCNVIGRVSASVVGQASFVSRPVLYTGATLLFSAAILAATAAGSFWAFVATLGPFGLCFGAMLSQMPGVLMELFGVGRLSNSLGYTMFAVGAGGLTLPFLGGFLADVAGVRAAFVLAAAAGAAAFAFAFAANAQSCRPSGATS